MDIDISDILAEVSRPTPVPGPGPGPGSSDPNHNHNYGHGYGYSYDGPSASSDHELLVRAWTAERCAPDLLPYPAELVERVMGRMRAQIARIEDITSGVETASDVFSDSRRGDGRGGGAGAGNNINLISSVLQTDLSRTQFLVRSYLRQRLAKITRHAVYYLVRYIDRDVKADVSTSTNMLSPIETQFLRSHQALLSEFYDSSFLASFPLALRRLDDPNASGSNGVGMVEGPDAGTAVITRCLAETWTNDDSLSTADTAEDHRDGENEGDDRPTVELRMRRGEIWVVRWRDVKVGVVKGMLEML